MNVLRQLLSNRAVHAIAWGGAAVFTICFLSISIGNWGTLFGPAMAAYVELLAPMSTAEMVARRTRLLHATTWLLLLLGAADAVAPDLYRMY